MNKLDDNIKTILFSRQQIADRISIVGRQISSDYENKNLLVLGVLKGSFIFMADLIREINIPLKTEFISVSSYGSSKFSSGNVTVNYEGNSLKDLSDKHVLIVEDILDTGNTLFKIKNMLMERNPLSVKICTLLDKPLARTADIQADYKCFDIENQFVAGYGLDFNEDYRNLPFIGIC